MYRQEFGSEWEVYTSGVTFGGEGRRAGASPISQLAGMMAAALVYKTFLLVKLGTTAGAVVADLSQGGAVGRAAAQFLAPDPVSGTLARMVGTLLG